MQRLAAQAGRTAFVLGVVEDRLLAFNQVTQGPDGLALELAGEGGGAPVPAPLFLQGLQQESGGDMDMRVFVKTEDGTFGLSQVRLEKDELEEGKAIDIITIVAGAEARARTAKDASVAPPRNSEDLPRGFRALVQQSGRPNLGKLPLMCVLASVPNQKLLDKIDADDQLPDELREMFRQTAEQGGTPCVVDLVHRRQNHVEIQLMSVDGDDMARMQTDAADVCADKVVADFEALGPGLPLFFMYRGKPYAATEFSAEGGAPAKLTLEPWQDVLESADAQEISDSAAMFAADGLL